MIFCSTACGSIEHNEPTKPTIIWFFYVCSRTWWNLLVNSLIDGNKITSQNPAWALVGMGIWDSHFFPAVSKACRLIVWFERLSGILRSGELIALHDPCISKFRCLLHFPLISPSYMNPWLIAVHSSDISVTVFPSCPSFRWTLMVWLAFLFVVLFVS